MNPELLGYVRKSKDGKRINIEIMKDVFDKVATYQSRDGHEFVSVVVNLERLREIIGDEREVTSACAKGKEVI